MFYFCLFVCLFVFAGCGLSGSHLSSEQREAQLQEAVDLRLKGKALREKSDFRQALEVQQEALNKALLLSDSVEIVQDYNQLGTTFRRLGRLEEALSFHYKALNWAEEMTDTSYQARKNLVVSLNGLGNVHLILGNDREAEICFRRALDGEIALGSTLGQAINYANLGAIMESKGEIDSAKVYYQLSLQRNLEIDNSLGIGLCHTHFGGLADRMGNHKVAQLEYQTAYEILEPLGDDWHAMSPLLEMCRSLLSQHKPQEAAPYLEKALSKANELHSFEHLKTVYRLMSEYQEQRGNYKAALDYSNQSAAYADSLQDPEENRRIREICIEYERQKVQREVTAFQQLYESEQSLNELYNILALVVFALTVAAIFILIYVTRIRKEKIDALNRIENMRTTFFTNITHEFRTPLTVILGMAEQLKDATLSNEQRVHFIRSIEKQGMSLLDLVNQLLSLSKLMAGYSQGEWRRGDVLSFLRMTLTGYKDFAQMHQLRLSLQTRFDTIEMDFIPEYIDKIVRNLLGNSFKFTPNGGQITLSLDVKDDSLLFDVSDTGCGIPQEDLGHVFELFFMGNESKLMGSTGIGLPFVQQMVHQMGGSVSVANNTTAGCTFHMVLPLRNRELGKNIKPWHLEEEYQRINQASFAAGKLIPSAETVESDTEEKLPLILVVEDNNDVVEYMHMLLHLHYRVRTATDGYDALHKTEKELPDLIVTDLMMPGMDGYALCRMVRQSEVMADVPIIVVSARSEADDRIRAIDEGADAFLLKPFNANEFQSLVAHLLERRAKQREKLQGLIENQEADNASGLSEEDKQYIERLNAIVRQQMASGDLAVDTLSQQMCTSRSVLNRRVRQLTGTSVAAYVLQLRMQHAKQLLLDTHQPIGEIALACGFDDLSYFSRVFRQSFGVTPSQFRK
ncbi:MAG: response regulator [Bacteroidales bacterium]|nr:response regulator [Bacteroidales bacterium]